MNIEYKQDGLFIDGTRYHSSDETVFAYDAVCGEWGDYEDDWEQNYAYHIKRNEKGELYLLAFVHETEGEKGDKIWSQYRIYRDKSFTELLKYIRWEQKSFNQYIINAGSTVSGISLAGLPNEETILKVKPELKDYPGSSEEPEDLIMITDAFYTINPNVNRLIPVLSYFGPVKW